MHKRRFFLLYPKDSYHLGYTILNKKELIAYAQNKNMFTEETLEQNGDFFLESCNKQKNRRNALEMHWLVEETKRSKRNKINNITTHNIKEGNRLLLENIIKKNYKKMNKKYNP